MTGLPKVQKEWRPRDTMRFLAFEPIERLTEALRRGDGFSEEAFRDLQLLQNRFEAFGEALDYRLSLLEDE
jgi:hypothetical protein